VASLNTVRLLRRHARMRHVIIRATSSWVAHASFGRVEEHHGGVAGGTPRARMQPCTAGENPRTTLQHGRGCRPPAEPEAWWPFRIYTAYYI
jgi:hypothetical protein